MKKALCALIFIFLISSIGLGQTVASEKILIDKSLLTQEQLNSYQKVQTIEQASKWVGLGKEVGEALNSGLTALKEQTIDLSETKLGKIAIFIIAYKVIGKDIIQLAFGIIFMAIWIPIMIYFIRRFFVNSKVVTSIDGPWYARKKEYQIIEAPLNNCSPGDASMYYWIFSCLIVILIGITAMIIFL